MPDPMLHDNPDRFRAALAAAEAMRGFSARLIEKDYYCSVLLHDMAALFEADLVFKGGTCLSKVHAEFFRLSEDLDFAISMSVDASTGVRRRAGASVREHLAGLPKRHKCFQAGDPLQVKYHHKHYEVYFSYGSVVTGEAERLKVEISLREPTILPPEERYARTLLLDPHNNEPVFRPVKVRVLSLREAYAEKVRAALTRREPVPAIRDFFDIDSAVRRGILNHLDEEVLRLVGQKLAVPGNGPVDLSESKIVILRGQIETDLRPVLRQVDHASFELNRVLALLIEMVKRLSSP